MTNKSALIAVGILVVGVITFFLMSSPKSTTQTGAPVETSMPSAVTTITAPSISFSPATLKLAKDAESTVSVVLDQNNQAVVGATVVIKYDPTKVSITQVTGSTLLPTVLSKAKIMGGMAEISVATPPDSKGKTQGGTVATFQVRGLSSASSTITFGDETTIASLDQQGNILKSKGTLKIN